MTDYNPVKVKNPSENDFGVLIHPNQDFYLVLETNTYGDKIKINIEQEEFLQLHDAIKVQGKHIILFEQKQNLTEFAKICRFYLGKVSIVGEKSSTSLSVTLEAENNKNIVTIVNPKTTSITVPIEEAIEVVLYDTEEDEWECGIVSGDSNLIPKLTYVEVVDPSVPEPPHYQNCLFAGHILKRNPNNMKETHMWFRIGDKSINSNAAYTSNLNGRFLGGKVTFNKKTDTKVWHEVEIFAVAKKKEQQHSNNTTTYNTTTYKPEKPEKKKIKLIEKKSPTLDTDTRSLYYHEYEDMRNKDANQQTADYYG